MTASSIYLRALLVNRQPLPEGDHADRSHRNAYQPTTVIVWRDGEPALPLVVMTYAVVRKDAGPHLPNAAYKRLFVTGARHWGLPPAYIAQLEAVAVG